jgi:hypothetical protein
MEWMSALAGSLLLAAMVQAAPPAQEKAKAKFKDSVCQEENLCAAHEVSCKSTSGELINRFSAMWTGKDWLGCWTNHEPPQSLTLSWRSPVTFNCCLVRWFGEKSLSSWFGMEYWDGQHYKLIYEISDNNKAEVIRVFSPVKTDRVRFTVFAHTSPTMGQGRIMIRYLGLYNLTEDKP